MFAMIGTGYVLGFISRVYDYDFKTSHKITETKALYNAHEWAVSVRFWQNYVTLANEDNP